MINFIVAIFLFLTLIPLIRFIFTGRNWDKTDPDMGVNLDDLDIKDLP